MRGLGCLLAYAVALLLSVADLFGVVHGFRRHGVGEGFAALLLPPYGVYLGLEGVFWHDDFAEVDWRVRLQNDEQTLLFLFTAAPSEPGRTDPGQVHRYGEALEEFARRVGAYPKERREHLRVLGLVYLRYAESGRADTLDNLRTWAAGSNALTFERSQRTKALEAELAAYPGAAPLLQGVPRSVEALNQVVRAKAEDLNPRSAVLAGVQSLVERQRAREAKTYTAIFGERPP